MKPSITQEHIDQLMEASEVCVRTEFEKVTVVVVRLPNGFVLSESAGAVSKENYNEDIGRDVCLRKIESRLWQLEGYRLQCEVSKEAV